VHRLRPELLDQLDQLCVREIRMLFRERASLAANLPDGGAEVDEVALEVALLGFGALGRPGRAQPALDGRGGQESARRASLGPAIISSVTTVP
jgi:hypothetical protein